MRVIRNKHTKKVMNYSEEVLPEMLGPFGYPVPGSDDEEEVLLDDFSVAEFESACLISAGAETESRPGEMFLHETVEEATSSTKTRNRGVKVKDRAVEAKHPDEGKSPMTDEIERRRRERGSRADSPITPAELREVERVLYDKRAKSQI